MKADLLRKKFLDFYKIRKHKIVESDSLLPRDDPTVLFTPAGMNQFKKEFLGFKSGFSRAATAQRCLRTDDLDKVGKTSVHHTFFEMLGNFSFGDYFKKEAITWAWEFLTQELKISPDKLWVSVYKDDYEAYKIWQELVKIPADKIIKLGDKDNFWPAEAKEKGPNGPCGPCSEIFYDFGEETGCLKPECNPACNCGRFAEVWNLVFTQFNRKEGGLLEPLPNKNIDTGMGLERLAAVMQGVTNNFETDLFKPLVSYLSANYNNNTDNNEIIYAITDHIRAVVFSIYDGVLPSNEARGYVIRKLIRKSIIHLRSLGCKQPFLYRLVPILADIMKDPYPELLNRQEDIAQIVLNEEKHFINTLDSSKSLFEEKFAQVAKKPDLNKAGYIVFELYDTFGIPLDLTKQWLAANNIEFSREVFDKELQMQKDRSKLKSTMKGDVFDNKDTVVGVTQTNFVGYKEFVTKSKILRIISNGKTINKVSVGQEVKVILNRTCFYPESGGQVADLGQIIKGKNVLEVLDTKKVGKAIVHSCLVKSGTFKKGDLAISQINVARRLSIARNHTATHLLQAALRKVLGFHIQQQGSLVAEDKFRFDFTHFKGLDPQQLDRIEEIVYEDIITNYPVKVRQMSLSQAKKSGALAFFAEKYETRVRVVSIGDISKELCGGTHLQATGQIGMFKIIHEGSVASGIRRIEATTGIFAREFIKEQEELMRQELEKKLLKLKESQKQVEEVKLKAASSSVEALLNKAEDINGKKLIIGYQAGLSIDLLRKNVDEIKKQEVDNTIVALGSQNQGRAFLVIGVTDDLTEKGLDASSLIKKVAVHIGGSGGGRKDFAQAGGIRTENFEQVFAELRKII